MYLSEFFRLRYGEQCREGFKPGTDPWLLESRFNRLNRDLKSLRSANAGDRANFLKALNYAYGRVGPLRWALLKPLLTDSEQPVTRLVPTWQRSTLPVFHPLLRELLTKAPSRRTKPAKMDSLINPPKLPDRAIQRDSEEARLVGPFSARREINIRWRYFSEEIRKLYPPLEVFQDGSQELAHRTHDFTDYGFQHKMVQHIVDLSGRSRLRNPTIPRRGKRCDILGTPVDVKQRREMSPLPTRWLRRRYRELLHTVPLVSQREGINGDLTYDIRQSPNALGESTKTTISRIGNAKVIDLEWITKSQTTAGRK